MLKVKAGIKYYLITSWTDLYFIIISENYMIYTNSKPTCNRELTAFPVAWIRNEKRCNPAILDCGQILGEFGHFCPKQRVILINPEFEDLGQTRYTNQNISGLFGYNFLWIGSELSRNRYMIERRGTFLLKCEYYGNYYDPIYNKHYCDLYILL